MRSNKKRSRGDMPPRLAPPPPPEIEEEDEDVAETPSRHDAEAGDEQ